MHIRILFLGDLAVRFGREHVIDFREGETLLALRSRLIAHFGDDRLLRPGVRVAVDQTVSPDTTVVSAGQEVAFLPIYSGG